MSHPVEFRPPIRGVQIDCRAHMLPFRRILQILDDLARWGYNTVLFEYEDRFPFSGSLARIAGEDALTRAQVREIVSRAGGLGIRIMPLVHCLGHLEYALRLPRLRPLGDGPADRCSDSTVCPSDPRSQKLFREMVGQVLDLHPDCRYFHMGGDEAALADDCPRCAPRKRAAGVSRLLVDHYVERADWLRSQGPDPVMWCDMPLRHPEAVDGLRGHVTIMDWNYWHGTRPLPKPTHIWQSGTAMDAARPRTWPPAHRAMFERYLFMDDGKRGRAFPYTPFLRDHGMPVIVAPAARCAGDSFCAPAALHVDNVIGAAREASRQHVLGCVVTSWALRRAPWPTTEYALIAGGMALKNPGVSRRAIDTAFAREHFGKADPRLARIALLLGATLTGLLDSFPEFDPQTGRWPGVSYDKRIERFQRPEQARAYRRQLAALRQALAKADALLKQARPGTARQRERVALWTWARDVLGHFAAFGDQVLKPAGTHDPAALRRFRAQAVKLSARTAKTLAPLCTPRAMLDEQRTRFGVHLDYIDAMLAAAGKGSARTGRRPS